MILNIFLITFILLIIIIYSYNKESFQNNETNGTLEWDLIYQHKSKWQDIEFLKRDEDNTWALYLNNEIQVYSEEYELSHYLQCSLPIEKYKPKNIHALTVIAAPEGIELIKEKHPDITLITACIDEKLNENWYIVPGLGDMGDRLFGTT